MMYPLEIYLFGQFSACRAQVKLKSIKARKVQELFWYLLIHNEKAHHRETLADLLWPENQRAKVYLRKTIWQLRKYVASVSLPDEKPILIANDEWLQIDPAAAIQVDALVFKRAYQATQAVNGRDLSKQGYANLRAIIGLYIGDLFEGHYADWCIFERERYRGFYLSLLWKLVDYCLAHQEYQTGINYCRRILQEDQVHERCHRGLMRLYYLSNNRVAAIRQYKACAKALADELSVQPSRLTRQLYRQILAEQPLAVPRETPGENRPKPSPVIFLDEYRPLIQERLPQEFQER